MHLTTLAIVICAAHQTVSIQGDCKFLYKSFSNYKPEYQEHYRKYFKDYIFDKRDLFLSYAVIPNNCHVTEKFLVTAIIFTQGREPGARD
ncbi:hypothetical protein OSTOST_13141 [Ostertagia ostertagi]